MPNEKSYGPSRSFEVIKLSELIRNYVIKEDDCARVELLNKVINGDELTEALAYLKLEIEDIEPKNQQNGDNKTDDLIKNLEKIIRGKEGTIIKEIREQINKYK